MTTLEKIRAEIADNHDFYFFAESNKDIALGLEYALEIIDKYAEQAEIQADYDRQKASGMTDEEWEYGQEKDAYDKVLAYLKANVDDFPDYHEAIEAVLKMKGGE